MLRIVRFFARLLDVLITAPLRAVRFIFSLLIFNPRLGRLRIVTGLLAGYVIFGLILVYPFSFFRGLAGQAWIGGALDYANERSLGTAIHDSGGRFVGIFDPVLDSEEDFNYTGSPIQLPGYIAYPDHKSLHVSAIPEAYWQCLSFHEDRYIRTIWNPWGIDLLGYLKIPVSTVQRSVNEGRIAFGAGGSTIPMQLARIFFKTPPSPDESAFEKIERKFKEWWLAPVIHRQLTRGGDITELKRWAANHFPLAQRTGGAPLYGVEQTGLILFGKPSDELTRAQQYVLAAAVNKPVILLKGGEKLNRYRLDTWRKVAEERAGACADNLILDMAEREKVLAELSAIADAPPDPKTPDDIAAALGELAPDAAAPASASPVRRANALVPSAKYGVRDEIKNAFGYGWRAHVRGVRLTLDVAQNLAFRERVTDALARMQRQNEARISPLFTLDPATMAAGTDGRQMPDIVVAAADRDGHIVRYYESNQTAAYFGSSLGRDPRTGKYDPKLESRFIASVAKMAAAVAIANEGIDTPETGYLDTEAPETGLESCRKGSERRLREANVAFACSLNDPIEWRMRQIPDSELGKIVKAFGLTRPEGGPGLAKGLTVGQLAASPRTIHRMSGAVLAALTDETGAIPEISTPTLVQAIDRTAPPETVEEGLRATPNPIRAEARDTLKTLLSAPLCNRFGTLHYVNDWCAERRKDVRLHFAKTGTRGTGASDPQAPDTVDLWVSGGIQFETGPAYSYVILIGTGNPSRPWARDLYAGSAAEPLLRILLEDLASLAARQGRLSDASATGQRVIER